MSGQDGTPRAAAEPAPSAKEYAATHPIVCAHAGQDGQGAHILAPGEKCERGKP